MEFATVLLVAFLPKGEAVGRYSAWFAIFPRTSTSPQPLRDSASVNITTSCLDRSALRSAEMGFYSHQISPYVMMGTLITKTGVLLCALFKTFTDVQAQTPLPHPHASIKELRSTSPSVMQRGMGKKTQGYLSSPFTLGYFSSTR